MSNRRFPTNSPHAFPTTTARFTSVNTHSVQYCAHIDVQSSVRYTVHMNQPIPIHEFRKNTKLYLDAAQSGVIYISRNWEVYALHKIGTGPLIDEALKQSSKEERLEQLVEDPDWGA